MGQGEKNLGENLGGESLGELAEHAALLRAALERVRNELAVAAAAEDALIMKLRSLGVSVGGPHNGLPPPADGLLPEETTNTMIDTFGIAGLPKSRRPSASRSSSSLSPSSTAGMLKAAAAGAGLMLGLAVFVLLVINLTSSSSSASSAKSKDSNANVAVTGPTTPARPTDESREIPPPPAAVAAPPSPQAEPSSSSPPPSLPTAAAPAKPVPVVTQEGVSTLTVVCTPRCDSVTSDNNSLGGSPTNIPITPGTHKLTLSAPNGVKKTLMVNINQGQAREVRVSMEQGSAHDYGF